MTTSDYTGTTGAPGLAASGGTGSTDAKEQARQTAGTAADEAKNVAGTAAGEAKNVAGTAADQAKHVAGEAKTQLHGLMDQTAREVDAQSRTQKDRLTETVRGFGDELESMASQSQGGLAGQLAHEVADRARALSSHLDSREPRDLLDDVRDFARRRPGTFLLGALAAGVVAGRLTRGAKDAQNGQHSAGAGFAGTGHGTASGDPLAGIGTPDEPPAYPAGSDVTDTGTATTSFSSDPAEPGGRP